MSRAMDRWARREVSRVPAGGASLVAMSAAVHRGARRQRARSATWVPASLLGLLLVLTVAGALRGQAHRNPAAPDSLRQIQTMEPRMGPPGTAVRLYTENIPLQARVVVGLGAIGTGFEELGTGDQGEFGEIGATVQVPQNAGWDRAVVFIIFNGNFAPTGLSDPFHVTDGRGRIQRTGTIVERRADGCVTFEDRDGYTYSLTGALGGAAPGDDVVVEGRLSRSVRCPEADTLKVEKLTGATAP